MLLTLFFLGMLEHQEDYDPRHKASSITSTCTNSSAPSFYSGRDSASSVCEDIDSPSLQAANFEGKDMGIYFLHIQQGKES